MFVLSERVQWLNTLHKEREQPWQSNCRLLITASKRTEKNQASETYLSRDVQCPCLAYQSALTPFFTRVLLPCFWPHRTALPLPECGGVMRGRGVWWMGPFAHAIFLCFWAVGCFYPWQLYRCDNHNKRPSWYHRKVLKVCVMTKKQKLRTGFLKTTLIWGPSDSLPMLSLGSCCQCASCVKKKGAPWNGRRLLLVACSQLHMSLLGYGAA